TGAVTMDRLTIADNEATTNSGGGITVDTAMTLSNSTVSGNTSAGVGGGVFSASAGMSTIVNVTISGNTSVSGGAIAATGAVTLRNVTLAFNSVAENGGGIWRNGAGEVSVTTSILAGNTSNGSPRNCETAGTATITSGGGNLSDDATCTPFSAAPDKPITP